MNNRFTYVLVLDWYNGYESREIIVCQSNVEKTLEKFIKHIEQYDADVENKAKNSINSTEVYEEGIKKHPLSNYVDEYFMQYYYDAIQVVYIQEVPIFK